MFPPNKRRTDDGTLFIAVAARDPDPYSGVDLDVRRPALIDKSRCETSAIQPRLAPQRWRELIEAARTPFPADIPT